MIILLINEILDILNLINGDLFKILDLLHL